MSSVRVVALFAFLILLMVAVGWVVGDFLMYGDWKLGMLIFLVIAIIINGIAYFLSSKIVLWSYKAKIITEKHQERGITGGGPDRGRSHTLQCRLGLRGLRTSDLWRVQ